MLCVASMAGSWSATPLGWMPVSPDWLSRYRAGQRDLVWHELRQAGSFVREPGLLEEAQLVCDEMARRARRNIDVILGRLATAGYRFHSGGDEDEQDPVTPHFPPPALPRSTRAGWTSTSALGR